MAIDKGLYQAPQGIEDLAQNEEPIEIEIIDPEEVDIHAGDTDISIKPGGEDDFSRNLAEEMDEGYLLSLAGDLVEDIEGDRASRKDWEKAYVEGIKLLGLQYEERTEPWNGACGVFHPMITEAVVRFQWFSPTGNSGATTVNLPHDSLVLAKVTQAKPVPVAALQAALWPSSLLEE